MKKIIALVVFSLLASTTSFAQTCTTRAEAKLIRNVNRAQTALAREESKLSRYQNSFDEAQSSFESRENAIEGERLAYVTDLTRIENMLVCISGSIFGGGGFEASACLDLSRISSCIGLNPQCRSYIDQTKTRLLKYEAQLSRIHESNNEYNRKANIRITRQASKVTAKQNALIAAEAALAACSA